MIYNLQKKFIKICAVSLSLVLLIIYVLIAVFSSTQLNASMDQLMERISTDDGRQPYKDPKYTDRPDERRFPGFMMEDTRFSARYFVVSLDKDGNPVFINTDSSSVTEETALEYAVKAMDKQHDRGWISPFRYHIQHTAESDTIFFLDGSMNLSTSITTVITVYAVLFGSFFIIFLLIVFFSKRAVKPIAESYEKQKQFITDANHELKTPLTLIMANLDIIESEIGPNEWLSDIRSESEQMSALVNQLVALTRMDEGTKNVQFEQFNLSELLQDLCVDFEALTEQKNETLTVSLEPDVSFYGDKSAVHRLLSILLDNAAKYCDPSGDILVSLTGGKHPTICIENTYSQVNEVELDKLFDRFYRSDKSRTSNGSFGIGLSIAKAIVQNHHGKISAYKKDAEHIGFKINFK
ncbi:MAG: sensor histidine kinase [Roseburia sp.]